MPPTPESVTLPTTAQRHDFILLKTWLLVGVTDALFASAVSVTVPPLSNGAFAIAAVYGMCIWLTMSLGVIPALVHRPPKFTLRWVVQLIGHIPFVAGPMVLLNRRRMDSISGADKGFLTGGTIALYESGEEMI